jgi:hypothetical protein
VVAAIMKSGLDKQLDGLARWHGVWRIPERIQRLESRSTGWVIIREEIRPFNYISDLSLVSESPEWVKVLQDYSTAAYRIIHMKSRSAILEARKQALYSLKELYTFEGTFYVAQAIDQLWDNQVLIADMHPGNLGYRINPTEAQPLKRVQWTEQAARAPLLIFDPGHSQAPEVEIADLW